MNSPELRSAKPDVVSVQPTLQSVSDSLDATPLDKDTDFMSPAPKRPVWRKVIVPTAFMLVVLVSLLTLLSLAGRTSSKVPTETNLTNTSANLKAQSTQLSTLEKQLQKPAPLTPNTLTVNGQLAVNNSLVLTPGTKPSNPVAGQIYYNQTINRPEYYNGKQFIILQSTAGTTSVNNNVTNVTNDYVTDVTNVSNGGGSTTPTGLLTSSAGTPGDLAMFATADTLGDSLVTENGTTLTVGGDNINVGVSGASEMVNLGSITGNSGTVIQAGTGGASFVSGPTNGASGVITIGSGNSSTTSAGNVDIDTGSSVVNGEVIDNYGFEDDTADNFEDWFGSTLTPTNTESHTGSFSLQVTETGNFWGVIQNSNVSRIPLVAGHHVLFSLWVKAATTPRQINANIILLNFGSFPLTSQTDTTSGWTEIEGLATIPAGVTQAFVEITGTGGVNGEVQYFDDIEATDLTANPTAAVLNLGATNAQEVNIGNLEELDATTIDGGGITLNAGAGTLDESGGDFNIAGSAESSIATNGGALTLTSGATATWGIGDASGGDGGDLTIVAGTGDDATNGGDLTLEGGQENGTGVSGNASLLSTAADDATGVVTVQSGDSSTTSAGNVDIDTGTSLVNGVVVADYGFEDGTDSMTPYVYSAETDTQDCTVAHTGSCSLNITGWGSGGGNDVDAQQESEFTLTPGHKYVFSMWVLAATASAPVGFNIYGIAGCNTGGTDSTSGWTQFTAVCNDPAGQTFGWFIFGFGSPTTETHYFDDMTVTDLSSSSTTAALNLGATNAQAVTIGNMNELDTTTIDGGSGITLDGGNGSLVAEAGTFALEGDADSTVSTEGSLAITSGAAATWNVGSNTSGAGGNFVLQAGNANGNNDGGNLILEGGQTGTGNGGSVIVQPQTDNIAAFRVEDTGGASLLTADTLNSAIVLGNDGTPAAVTVRGGVAVGTNVAGADLTIQGSDGTGGANGGNILIQTGQSAVGGIQLDADNGVANSGPIVSMSYTVGNQQDRILIVDANTAEVYSGGPTGITYDSIPLTRLDSVVSPGSEDGGTQVDIWYLLNPPSGTNPIVATYGGISTGGEIFGAMTFYDVDQSNPFGTPVSATGSVGSNAPQPTSLSVPTTNTSQVVIDNFGEDNGPNGDALCTTTNGAQTIAWNEQSYDSGCGSYQVASGGNVTVTYQAPQVDWADVGVALNPAQAGSVPLQATSGSSPDAMQTRLDVTASGNVGVDNSNPQYALDVTGTVSASTSVLSPEVDSTPGGGSLAIGSNYATGIVIGNATNNITTTIQGLALVKPTAGNDAQTVFQVQNADGSDTVLNVDTSNLIVTVAGSTGDFATLAINNAHFSSTQTTAPTVTGVTNCGSGGTANVTAGSTDTAGSLAINTGSGSPTTCDTTIKFNSAYTSAPKTVILTPTLALGGSVAPTAEVESVGANSFTIEVAPTNAGPSATYGYYYLVVQ